MHEMTATAIHSIQFIFSLSSFVGHLIEHIVCILDRYQNHLRRDLREDSDVVRRQKLIIA